MQVSIKPDIWVAYVRAKARTLQREFSAAAAAFSLGCTGRDRLLLAQENAMPQSPHERIAELHNLAAHAHTAAAVAHGKGDHLTAHELSVQAHEHSINARKLSEELVKK